MSSDLPPGLLRSLDHHGCSSVTDFFLERPELHFWSAAKVLSDELCRIAPIDLERALRAECERRDDFHFFARMALMSALHSFHGQGWGEQHYMLGGKFAGILGDLPDKHLRACWDHLLQQNLPEGWKPESIFEPILESALQSGFPAGMAFPAR